MITNDQKRREYLEGKRDVHQPVENRTHHEWDPPFPDSVSPSSGERDFESGRVVVDSQGDKWSMVVQVSSGQTAHIQELNKDDAEDLHGWLAEWLERQGR